jgi:hypothetical protein
MRTLKQLRDNIDEILRKYPHWENLPLIYSIDAEGNEYHINNNSLSPTQVEDVNQWYLEIVGFFDDTNPNDDERDISEKDVNCICIN